MVDAGREPTYEEKMRSPHLNVFHHFYFTLCRLDILSFFYILSADFFFFFKKKKNLSGIASRSRISDTLAVSMEC